ncbi:hypothetical protein A33Q_3016 [Indibacter alkaliphilus LW1]|uniref:Uncharacterized protein n=1 Tax=Indibacter alkaliphilus (strain CCUG 57479 / KCTC 22604 / LW1) TaxID=1189612 RepID=S2D9U3_INDAL|nr:hypothetical protein A33Q_3016 [Indibacter alkaliphilus LW1]
MTGNGENADAKPKSAWNASQTMGYLDVTIYFSNFYPV